MSDHHTPPHVSEAELQHAHVFWTGFMKYTMWGIMGVVALLILLALIFT